MAIYPPESELSNNDKRLLKLLSRVLLEASNVKYTDNVSDDNVVLTDQEAGQLTGLIDSLLNSKEFVSKSSFIDELSVFPMAGEKTVKSIYLTGLAGSERPKFMPFFRWNEFKSRLGLSHLAVGRGKPISPMKYNYFLKMEEILFQSLDINPVVIDLLMRTVKLNEKEALRSLMQPNVLPRRTIKKLMVTLKDTAESGLSRVNITSAITFIANSSVLFTTRDWGVAGTLSCMASAVATLEKP